MVACVVETPVRISALLTHGDLCTCQSLRFLKRHAIYDKKMVVLPTEWNISQMKKTNINPQTNEPLDEKGRFLNKISCRYRDEFFELVLNVDLMDVS